MTIFYYVAKARCWLPEWRPAFGGASVAILLTGGAAAADLEHQTPAALQSAEPVAYNWTGFYAGVHIGSAWGNSNWTASSGGSAIDKGSLSLYQSYDGFNQGGSWFNGVQIGYNRLLQNRVVIGAEADFSASAFPNYHGNNTGNTISVVKGTETYSDNIFAAGTVRGRIGYAPGNWLFYATGGLAWTSEKYSLASANGIDGSTQQRVGWAAGGGVEAPLAPHWTIKAEYLYTGYGNSSINFPLAGQRFTSDLSEQEVRLGVNYQFGDFGQVSVKDALNPGGVDPDRINIHGQTTLVWQGYPAFLQRPGSTVPGYLAFPAGGQGREIGDATLYAGIRLWKGAEAWINPEIDQGLGLNNNIGVSAFPNAEAFKLGSSEPYARVQRAFIRQTIDLGGATETVAADINQFAQTQTSDRLVVTLGRLNPIDIFDTNTYAANSKTQFLNWGLFYALPFDYGGDAWGYGWGAVAEWYQGRFTYRLGWFDTEKSAISNTPNIFGVDPTFGQYDIISEIEERHVLWGQPGKVKLNVNLISGRLGTYSDAIANINSACEAGIPETSCVRKYTRKVDAHINIEQAITSDIGIFSRVGWAPGYVELLAITDTNFFASGGVSVKGTSWGRPSDTVGIGFVYNQISKAEQQYLNLGGFGSFVGDGQLTNPQAEKVFEAYYSYQATASTAFTLDYQLFENPAFNGDRGPVNLFAGRVHWQF